MKTLTYTFIGLALYGLGLAHIGGVLLCLLSAAMCWYAERAMGASAMGTYTVVEGQALCNCVAIDDIDAHISELLSRQNEE